MARPSVGALCAGVHALLVMSHGSCLRREKRRRRSTGVSGRRAHSGMLVMLSAVLCEAVCCACTLRLATAILSVPAPCGRVKGRATDDAAHARAHTDSSLPSCTCQRRTFFTCAVLFLPILFPFLRLSEAIPFLVNAQGKSLSHATLPRANACISFSARTRTFTRACCNAQRDV